MDRTAYILKNIYQLWGMAGRLADEGGKLFACPFVDFGNYDPVAARPSPELFYQDIQKCDGGNACTVPTACAVASSFDTELINGMGKTLGQECQAEDLSVLLYGEVNPSGRLAETFPLRLEDNPSYLNFPGDGENVNYAEGVYVGYRYYDTKKMPVRWAFGHGLSYTTYEYSNLKMPVEALDDEGSVRVTVSVKNTGGIAGKEVVQLYVSDKNGTAGRPVKELKGFAKVALNPGETKTVEFTLTARDLSFYHEGLGDWYAPTGTYEVLVGHASDEIALTGELSFNTKKLPPLYVDGSTTIGQLLAHPVTAPVVGEMMQKMQSMMGGDDNTADTLGTGKEMMEAMMTGMPLKSLASFAGVETAEKIEQMMGTLNQMLNN